MPERATFLRVADDLPGAPTIRPERGLQLPQRRFGPMAPITPGYADDRTLRLPSGMCSKTFAIAEH